MERKFRDNAECSQPNKLLGLKIKVSVDAAGPSKSIRNGKDIIKNLKDTCKQAKENKKK